MENKGESDHFSRDSRGFRDSRDSRDSSSERTPFVMTPFSVPDKRRDFLANGDFVCDLLGTKLRSPLRKFLTIPCLWEKSLANGDVRF